MRCLALAEACRERHLTAALAYADMTAGQLARWDMEQCARLPIGVTGGSSEDADVTARLARELGCEWVVIDGYHFRSEYQRRLKSHGCRVLCVDDDYQTEHYYVDVVLNQNAYADPDRYGARESFTRLLTGSRYALLRREFRQRAHDRARLVAPIASRLLVTLGGSDCRDVVDAVMTSLEGIQVPMDVRVTLGDRKQTAAHPKLHPESGQGAIQIVRETANIADLMTWADMAIAGAGTTSWELAFMGVPFVAVILAENQVQVANSLDRLNVAINVGRADSLQKDELARIVGGLATDRETRNRMSEAGQRLVDGYGVDRALQALGLTTLRLVRAAERDARLLWEWANEPAVRRFSFHSDPITWETHRQWFARELGDPQSSIWIAYDVDDEPVGQIRFNGGRNEGFYISLSVRASRRGRGYSRPLIAEGLRHASKTFPGQVAHAQIKCDNIASIRAFQAAGFTLAGNDTIEGHAAFHYVWQPSAPERA
jgi:UDP-2,4-diacetamido-2,4,6-trideoxy-beta-L-altropyranose hydrolase